ncbi:Mu transposase domain-containing protein [Streptomyces spinoverrucosus]|uniref:Mu transposase domain-containing protein n=1 Tax=Streptomyces spinoverrucosus TaxID=284043 RepID=UPI0035B127EE
MLWPLGRWFAPRVNRFSQISVRGNASSIPVRFIRRQLGVLLHANDLVVYGGRTVITRHECLGGWHKPSTQPAKASCTCVPSRTCIPAAPWAIPSTPGRNPASR